jgi:lipid II:glycine glycyltransferase (peptidoglycan interpeptide bridge formation enzyme)
MNGYRIVTKIDHRQWSDFVLYHPHGNFFQSPEVFALFKGTDNYEPLFFIVLDEAEKIKGILLAVIQKESPGIMGYFSSRTIIWGGPLIYLSDDKTEGTVLGMLLDELVRQVGSRTIYIQVRNLFDMSNYWDEFRKKGFTYNKHLNYIVETGNREETENKISKAKMRQIRKSFKSGAKVIEPGNIEQVKAFYNILKSLYKTRVRRPLPHWSFFKTFFELGKSNLSGKYFLVEYRGSIIGGIMCPITAYRTIYEWYVAGLDSEYKHQGIYPSVLATWAPIDYALDNGLKYFDFMGAGKPGQDSGVREFKARFGGTLVEYGRFEKINNKSLFILGKLALKILGALRT